MSDDRTSHGDSHDDYHMIGEIAGVATAVAVVIASLSLLAQSRDRKFALAQVYIQRYWEVDEHLLSNSSPAPDSADARRYLRLCEDEFDAARQGWLDIAVWRTWHAGIRSQVTKHGLHQSTHEFEQLDLCLRGDVRHRATRCPGLGELSFRRRFWWFVESPLGS